MTYSLVKPTQSPESPELEPLRLAIENAHRADESACVQALLPHAQLSPQERTAARTQAQQWIEAVRGQRQKSSGVDALMNQFRLSTREGLALMRLAEALLRIPDTATRDALLRDCLGDGAWSKHIGQSASWFVNAAAGGLWLSAKLLHVPHRENTLFKALRGAVQTLSLPLIRQGVNQAMRMMGKQFVAGEQIESALAQGKAQEARGYRYSFDMLGEAALTQHDANRYYQDYERALHAIGQEAQGAGIYESNGISVKLSALHPRYERAQYARVMAELLPRLKALCLLAKHYAIGINIDAEEAHRLDLSLDLLRALLSDPELAGFDGIGFVVQAYQKRCPAVIDYLIALARQQQRKLMVRLVKGAYWDSEVKWAQVDGVADYPVYTRKVHTDLSYFACARKLLAAQDVIFPQFATHNAYTLAAILQLGQGKRFECQCLYGMGESLYNQVLGQALGDKRVRIYAPVGTHQTLLAYLVRRLLENGANSSFVNQMVDANVPISALTQDPAEWIQENGIARHVSLPVPAQLFGAERQNSRGLDVRDESALRTLSQALHALPKTYHAHSLIADAVNRAENHATSATIHNPAQHSDVVGKVQWSSLEDVQSALHAAENATKTTISATQRRHACLRFADLLEQQHALFMDLAVREAGKTLANAVGEIREAVDFCRYYAQQSTYLPEQSDARLLVAISPWNFPLAIFVGQVMAALMAGNVVLAKPAEQTPLIAYHAVKLMHDAGFATEQVQLLLGAGDIGQALVGDKRIGGVLFTGSTEVARHIQQNLFTRADNPLLIAETGGMNAMIVDSSALPEQVVNDVLQSAFDSAGQRCSALRILCVQEDIADEIWHMLTGAMNELRLGMPTQLHTDIGPVIDRDAQSQLQSYIASCKNKALRHHELALPPECATGTFVAPVLLELQDLDAVQREVFGPVLHFIRYRANDIEPLMAAINRKGYALTHGIHSRVDSRIAHIKRHIHAGNIYVNRNMVGAVVGVQPFGGHGLSGTGPKAGGALYLRHLSALPHHATIPHDCPSPETHQQLLGSTGEENRYSVHLPAWVYLYGGDAQSALALGKQLLAKGIHLVVAPDAPARQPLMADNPPTVMVKALDDAFFQSYPQLPFRHVLALSPVPPEHKQQLACHTNLLLKIIDVATAFDERALYEEVLCSTNTTAAGGNAGLMASCDA